VTKAEVFPRYHHVDGGFGTHAPSHQIRPEGAFSETKQPQRETRILNALPLGTYAHNTITIKLRAHQAGWQFLSISFCAVNIADGMKVAKTTPTNRISQCAELKQDAGRREKWQHTHS
jgi:hypothetical protein